MIVQCDSGLVNRDLIRSAEDVAGSIPAYAGSTSYEAFLRETAHSVCSDDRTTLESDQSQTSETRRTESETTANPTPSSRLKNKSEAILVTNAPNVKK